MNSTVRTVLFWLFMVLLAVVLWKMASTGGQTTREKELSYTDFLNQVQQGNIKEVTFILSQNSAEVTGEFRQGGEKFHGVTIANSSIPDVNKALQEKGVEINNKEVSRADWFIVLVNAAPVLLLVAIWIFMMRQMQAGGNKALSFGKSRARLLTAQQKKATFKDVAGTD